MKLGTQAVCFPKASSIMTQYFAAGRRSTILYFLPSLEVKNFPYQSALIPCPHIFHLLALAANTSAGFADLSFTVTFARKLVELYVMLPRSTFTLYFCSRTFTADSKSVLKLFNITGVTILCSLVISFAYIYYIRRYQELF